VLVLVQLIAWKDLSPTLGGHWWCQVGC